MRSLLTLRRTKAAAGPVAAAFLAPICAMEGLEPGVGEVGGVGRAILSHGRMCALINTEKYQE